MWMNEPSGSATIEQRTHLLSGALSFSVVLLLVLLAGIACDTQRPRPDQWSRTWAGRPVLPNAVQLDGQQARSLCEQLLIDARGAREKLLPTPDPQIDETVEAWILRVENLAYECAASPIEPPELRRKREAIQILEAEVEAAMKVASGAGPESSS
jgi:hypothetical protein